MTDVAEQSEWPSCEADVAAVLVSHMRSKGRDPWQEVPLDGRKIDIVDSVGGMPWAFEVKLHFGLEVIAQAWHWTQFAQRCFVVVPVGKESETRNMAALCCGRLGLDVIEVYESGKILKYTGRNFPCNPQPLLEALRPEQKTFTAAGGSSPVSFTDFQGTLIKLGAYLDRQPEGRALLREAVAEIEHHWPNDKMARTELAKRLSKGRVPGFDWSKKESGGRTVVFRKGAKG